MKAKLTDGRIVRIEPTDFNAFGQVNVSKLVERGIAADTSEMCYLLGAAPSNMRDGFVFANISFFDPIAG